MHLILPVSLTQIKNKTKLLCTSKYVRLFMVREISFKVSWERVRKNPFVESKLNIYLNIYLLHPLTLYDL